MSVGAGSIKRAAKVAEGKSEVKAEVKAAKAAEGKSEAKAAKGKAAEVLKQEKAEEKAASPKPVVNPSVTYGIGQELPIHLM